MKKYAFRIALLCTISTATPVFAQNASVGDTENVVLPIDFRSTKFVKHKPPKKEARQGNPYLLNQKEKGTIYTSKYGIIEGFAINYNLESHQFEIYIKNEIKALPDTEVDSFSFIINNKKLVYKDLRKISTNDLSSISGFGHIKASHRGYIVLDKLDIKLQAPNYNLITNTGTKNETIDVTETPYLIFKKTAYKFPLKKKQLKKVFGNDYYQLENYAKGNKLNLNKQSDLIDALANI